MKRFIGSWTWKVHRRGISGVDWLRGRWRDRAGLHFSGILWALLSSVCWPPAQAGCLQSTEMTPCSSWAAWFPFYSVENTRFPFPNHPAKFWASLWLDSSLKGFYNLHFSFPPPTLGQFRILHHGIPGHDISVVLPNDLFQWNAGLKSHTK